MILASSPKPEIHIPVFVSSSILISLNSTLFSEVTVLTPSFPWSFRDNMAGDILWAGSSFPFI